ncbi:MAG: 4Fe-4S binding protein [Emergencia sp.]|nr:4Fe-4S binding protein [Emergencia sp.]
MAKYRRIASVGKTCVSCGSCEKVCPKDAIKVYLGVIARVDDEKCVGCGKCEKICPAAVIDILEREAVI